MRNRLLAFVCFFCLLLTAISAQDIAVPKAQQRRQNLKDSLTLSQVVGELDSMQLALLAHLKDSIALADSLRADSVKMLEALKSDTIRFDAKSTRFVPDPKRAMWLAIAFPGGGQIYNRKYWKLPIIYGGFLGCFYALTWNNGMYRDYSQAYIDIMDSDPNTQSYMNFIPPTYDVAANTERLKDIFRRKKDFYRRYRDLSFFCMLGVYALGIIDAYVDAELSSFDISSDLSLKVHPAIINDGRNYLSQRGLGSNSYGFQFSLDF